MSKIYGLFGGSHNANVAYIENGQIIAAIEEERLDRKKSGLNFGAVPSMAIKKIEEITGIKLQDADYVCWALPSPDKFRKKLYLHNEVFYEHHDCHASGAYYTSGFDGKVLVVTLDGGGRRSYGKVFLAENGKMKMVKRIPMELNASLGQVWMQMTEAFGWKMLKDEGKLMGMAGHGSYNETIYNQLKQTIYLKDGEFLPAGNISEILLLIDAWRKKGYFTNDIIKKDIAYNLQKLTESLVIEYLEYLHKLYPEYTKLAVAGGIFANVKMNQFINELQWVEEMYVFPPMGDDGLGLGAAILKSVELGEFKVKRFDNMFLGVSYSEEEILNTWFDKYEKDLNYIIYDPKWVANELHNGKIVGFFQGKFEYGPRALGARSILVRPTDIKTHTELNNRLNRHEIMPFAPVVLAEEANRVFYCNKSHYTAEFMTMCYTTRDEWIEKIPAVIHAVDKTARPQIVRKDKNPKFYEILQEYYFISNIPILLNTSFNTHNEPIINSIDIALERLREGVIDILVAENYVFLRSNNEK